MKGLGIKLAAFGAAFLAINVGLGFGGVDMIIHMVIRMMIRLKEGTDVWRMWTTVPIDLYLKMRIFNITNPEGMANGEKPKLVEMGPYVFKEDLEKVDITIDSENDTIRYRQTKTYYFQPEMSKGSVDDEVTFINVIFLSVVAIAKEFAEDDFMLSSLDDMLSSKGEKLTKTAKVRELLFDGVSVAPYIELLESEIVKATAEAAGVELTVPEAISDGKFGIFKGKNGSDDGWYVVKSGIEDSNDIGRIISHNGHEFLSIWKGSPEDGCNRMNGTDSTIYPPFMTKESVVPVFISQVCRTLFFTFHDEGEAMGINTYNFEVSPLNFASPNTHPPNWCFCPTLKNETGTCEREGVFNVMPCIGAPLLISFPHFLGADKALQEAVDGLNPNHEEHQSAIHFHPLSGSPITAEVKMQFGIEMVNEPVMPSFADVQNAVVPLAWLEENAVLDNKNRMMLWLLDSFQGVYGIAKYLLILIGVLIFLAGSVLAFTGKTTGDKK